MLRMQKDQSKIKGQGKDNTELLIDVKATQKKELTYIIDHVVEDSQNQDTKDTSKRCDQTKSVKKQNEREIKIPLKCKRRIQKRRKVMASETSDSDNDVPRTFITSAVVHASQTGEPCPVRKVAAKQHAIATMQMKKFVEDLDIIQVDNSTQPNAIAIKKPLTLPTSLITLNKLNKANESIKFDSTKVIKVPDERKESKEVRKPEGDDFLGSENEVLGKPKEATTLKKKMENQSTSETKNKSKKYPRKRKSAEPEKKKSKMNKTHAKRRNRTTHNSNESKNLEHHLEISNFMTKFLEDVDLSRTGDYSKTDMVSRTERSYCESFGSDVPLARNRKRQRSYPSKEAKMRRRLLDSRILNESTEVLNSEVRITDSEEPLLRTFKRKKLTKVITSKSVTSQKTEISSLPELCIEDTKKQDQYILYYVSSSSDQDNNINQIMNESSQDRKIKSEIVQTCTDNSGNKPNKPCYVNLKRSKLSTLSNNSISNSSFDKETMKDECMQNCNNTDANKEVNSQACENRCSNNEEEIVAQLSHQPIASWICTGNNQPQLSQRFLEVLLKFIHDATEIVLEDMNTIPAHLSATLPVQLDKFVKK